MKYFSANYVNCIFPEIALLPVVYGEWVVKNSLWEFVVNNRKGGRMFLVHDGCTHGELPEMAKKIMIWTRKSRRWC